MKLPRGLTAEEEAAWARLAASVDAFAGRRLPQVSQAKPQPEVTPAPPKFTKAARAKPAPRYVPLPIPAPKPARVIGHAGLDATWDRKLKSGTIAPDYTLDLHDHFLDAAHDRLESGLAQARAMDARLVLVITGRPRPVDAADRASKRGVIRAKFLDWLAAGTHSDAIAAIRKAHRRHGGEGALYVVLRRNR